MRIGSFTAALALVAAAASGSPGNIPSKTVDPKRHWYPVRDDGPAYNPKNDGPAYNPENDGPAHNPENDGPAHDPENDGPAYNPENDGPAHNPENDGPAYNPENDGPASNPKDDSPDEKSADNASDKPKGNSTSSIAAPTSTPNPAAATGDFTVTILADSNRDGKVDIEGTSDSKDKDTWTEASGAIFLANIGDTNGRCKQTEAFKNTTTPQEKLAKCHDADDDEQRAPQFLAPMRTVPIRGLSDNATGSIMIAQEPARSLVRIFRSSSDGWDIVGAETVFSAEDLQKGLTLGIDARSTRIPGGWDGRVSVDFIVKDGSNTAKDTVMLRVAPVVIHHHKQQVTKMFASSLPSLFPKVKSAVQEVMRRLGGSMALDLLPTDDPWAQDYFEPAYMSMPGPDGKPISMRIMVEGRRDWHKAQRLLYTLLRDTGVGAVDPVHRTADYHETVTQITLQAGGNTEAIPPYEYNGRKFPAGRIIMGGDDKNLPRQLEFYRAQEVQDPIIVDSLWLNVKHFDEMMQFLPSNSSQGFALVAVDPEMGINMLRDASKAGHGGEPVISSTKVLYGPTIDEFLASKNNIDAAQEVGRRMTANINHIKNETGIADEAIFRMPMLVGRASDVDNVVRAEAPIPARRFVVRRQNQTDEELPVQEILAALGSHGTREEDGRDKRAVQRRQRYAPGTYDSYLPSLVNGVPLPSSYMAPMPFGPTINGVSIFETAAKSIYERVGFPTVAFHDAWVFHVSIGDIHCMTNTLRDTSQPWW